MTSANPDAGGGLIHDALAPRLGPSNSTSELPPIAVEIGKVKSRFEQAAVELLWIYYLDTAPTDLKPLTANAENYKQGAVRDLRTMVRSLPDQHWADGIHQHRLLTCDDVDAVKVMNSSRSSPSTDPYERARQHTRMLANEQ